MITPVIRGGSAGTDKAFVDLLLASLDQRWEKYRRELNRCRKKCSEKAVHDLRVASRRLISTIDVISAAVEDDRLSSFREAVRRHLKEAGPLRDVQVQLSRLEAARDVYPELEGFYTLLLLREQKLLSNMERRMRKVRVGLVEQQVRELRATLPPMLEEKQTGPAVKAAAIGVVAAGFLKSSSLLRKVDPADPGTIHRLRVSFKRFRYGTEALQHVLPGIAPSMLKAMDRYQLRMGVIQDLEVFTAAFRRYLSRVRRGMHINLLPFQQELAREHQTRVREFLAGAGELNSFWTLAKQTERRHKQTSSLHQPSLN